MIRSRSTAAILCVAGLASATLGQQRLMITDSGAGDRVMLFDPQDGSVVDLDWITDIGAVGWSFTTPKEAMVVGNEIWVSDQVVDIIARFDFNRAFLGTITAHPGGGVLDNIRGMGTDGTNVYVTLMHGTAALRGVCVYTTAGAPVAFLPGSGSYFDAERFGTDLLVSNSTSNNIERWSTAGTFLGNFATGVVFPQQVVIHTDGSVISVSSIANPGIEGVYHHNADGSLRRFIDTEGLKTQFGEHVPRGSVVLGDGHYLIAASTGVYKYFVDTGIFTRIVASVDAQYITRITLGASCYANCDNSTTPPVLNVNDFTCFLNQFAAGDSRANCDQSTTPPVLNVNDFTCFLNAFAAGCP
ncbi:MAG: hypothetical protein JNM80_12585 [Phycisphaerae bacterium]|nr:hypothetical protein [Phycisphaerae bacterium]